MDPLQLKAQLEANAELPALEALCDAFSEEERTLAIRALNKPELAKLYAKAENPAAKIDASFFVPTDLPAYTAVEWRGRNSLPLFSNFLKVMTRAPDGTVLGWNANGTAWAVGPGYFTVKPHPEGPHQVLFDYVELPSAAPPGWPKVKSNRTGMSFFVYKDLNDRVRPVGGQVIISAAFDATTGKHLGHYFALARGPLLPAVAPEAPTASAPA